MKRIQGFKINMDDVKGELRKKKLLSSCEKLIFIMKSNLFKELILTMPKTWLLGESKSSTFKYLTNTERYLLLMSGKEEWNNIEDYEVDLIVGGYVAKFYSTVIGYMNPGHPKIFLNYKYLDLNSEKKVASNIAHEWTHTAGARHGGNDFRSSFSYFINYAIEYCWDHFYVKGLLDITDNSPLPKPKYEYKTVCYRSWRTLWFKRCYQMRVEI